MAEYCKKCADGNKYIFEGYPVFCELCGKSFDNISFWKWFKLVFRKKKD